MSSRFLRYFNVCLMSWYLTINQRKILAIVFYVRFIQGKTVPIWYRFSSVRQTWLKSLFLQYSSFWLIDILCVQVYSSTRGIEGFQLLYELSPSVIYCNGKINVISVVSCYIAIDGTEAYQIHGNSNFRSLCKLSYWVIFSDDLPMNFLGVLSSRLQNFNMKVTFEPFFRYHK